MSQVQVPMPESLKLTINPHVTRNHHEWTPQVPFIHSESRAEKVTNGRQSFTILSYPVDNRNKLATASDGVCRIVAQLHKLK